MRYRDFLFFLLFVFVIVINAENKTKQVENQDSNLDSLSLHKKELMFKAWLKDTISVLQEVGSSKNDEIGLLNSCIKVSEDSLSFEIKSTLSKVIQKKDKFPQTTIIGSTLYNLKSEHVHLPSNSYEFRIAYVERYDVSYVNLVHEKSYEYNYISIIPLHSETETCYTLMKGNLVGIAKKKILSNWISQINMECR